MLIFKIVRVAKFSLISQNSAINIKLEGGEVFNELGEGDEKEIIRKSATIE